jgi:hypothetical protein
MGRPRQPRYHRRGVARQPHDQQRSIRACNSGGHSASLTTTQFQTTPTSPLIRRNPHRACSRGPFGKWTEWHCVDASRKTLARSKPGILPGWLRTRTSKTPEESCWHPLTTTNPTARAGHPHKRIRTCSRDLIACTHAAPRDCCISLTSRNPCRVCPTWATGEWTGWSEVGQDRTEWHCVDARSGQAHDTSQLVGGCRKARLEPKASRTLDHAERQVLGEFQRHLERLVR